MLPKRSLIKYICINAFDYYAIIVYFTVLKPGILYVTWYSPTYVLLGKDNAPFPFQFADSFNSLMVSPLIYKVTILIT